MSVLVAANQRRAGVLVVDLARKVVGACAGKVPGLGEGQRRQESDDGEELHLLFWWKSNGLEFVEKLKRGTESGMRY